jgi:hypothetical protein
MVYFCCSILHMLGTVHPVVQFYTLDVELDLWILSPPQKSFIDY